MNDNQTEKVMEYLLYLLAVFGLLFLLILLVKLTLWCLQCNLRGNNEMRINLLPNANHHNRIWMRRAVKKFNKNQPPTPPPPTYNKNETETEVVTIADATGTEINNNNDNNAFEDDQPEVIVTKLNDNGITEPTYAKLAFSAKNESNTSLLKKCYCPFCSPSKMDEVIEMQTMEQATESQPTTDIDENKVNTSNDAVMVKIKEPEVEDDAPKEITVSGVHKLVEVVIEQTAVNRELEKCVSNQSLDTEDALKTLDDTIEEIELLTDEINQMEVDEQTQKPDEENNSQEHVQSDNKQTDNEPDEQMAAVVNDNECKTTTDYHITNGNKSDTESNEPVVRKPPPVPVKPLIKQNGMLPQCAVYAKVIDQIKKRNLEK